MGLGKFVCHQLLVIEICDLTEYGNHLMDSAFGEVDI
jgi:hypothetical protein